MAILYPKLSHKSIAAVVMINYYNMVRIMRFSFIKPKMLLRDPIHSDGKPSLRTVQEDIPRDATCVTDSISGGLL